MSISPSTSRSFKKINDQIFEKNFFSLIQEFITVACISSIINTLISLTNIELNCFALKIQIKYLKKSSNQIFEEKFFKSNILKNFIDLRIYYSIIYSFLGFVPLGCRVRYYRASSPRHNSVLCQ